jgi:hypothetical protein
VTTIRDKERWAAEVIGATLGVTVRQHGDNDGAVPDAAPPLPPQVTHVWPAPA